MIVTLLPRLDATKAARYPLSAALKAGEKRAKEDSVCIITSALFKPDETSFTKASAVEHTGIIALDIDLPEDMPDREKWDATLELAIRAWPHTLAMQRSYSKGFHVFVQVEPVPLTPDEHTVVARELMKVFQDTFSVAPDKACVDIVRRMFVTTHEAYISGEPISIAPGLHDVPVGQRHTTLRDWAYRMVMQYGHPQHTLQPILERANAALGEPETPAQLAALVRDLPTPERAFAAIEDIVEAWSDAGTIAFRHNIVTGGFEFKAIDLATGIAHWAPEADARWMSREARRALPGRPKWKTSRGFEPIPANILTLAMHAAAKPYNPVLDILTQFDGVKPASDALFRDATAVCFDCDVDEHPEHLDLLRCVYTDLGLRLHLVANPARHVSPSFFTALVGPQGCGKSAFAEELLPGAFQRYRGQLTARDWRDAVEQATSRFVLEVPEISGRRMGDGLSRGEFRALVTGAQLDTIPKYARSPVSKKNNAVLIATSNMDGSALLDAQGGRRQAVVTYPPYASIAESVANGVRVGDFLREHAPALLIRGLTWAQELLDSHTSPFVTVGLDPRYETARLEAQQGVGDPLDQAVVKAFLMVLFEVPGWDTPVLSTGRTPYSYCPIGGMDPGTLRALTADYVGHPVSSQQVNKSLLILPGLSRAMRASPIHRSKGVLVESPAALASMVQATGLEALARERIEADPRLRALQVAAEWFEEE